MRLIFVISFMVCAFLFVEGRVDAELNPHNENIIFSTHFKEIEKVRMIEAKRKLGQSLLEKKLLKMFPPYLYFSQRVIHIEAEIKIDPFSQTVESEGRVDFEVGYDNPSKFYFLINLENASFWDEEGALEFKLKKVFGIQMAEIVAKGDYLKGEKKSLFFNLSGKPSCEPVSLLGVLVCTFSQEISFSALSLMVPSSLAGDYATFDIKFVIPEGYTLASTGVTKEVFGNGDGTVTNHAVQDYPTELHSFGFAPYKVSAMPFVEKWYRTYTLSSPLTELSLGKNLQDMQDIVFHYSTEFGDFIFPKMEAIEISSDAGAAFGWPAMLMIPTFIWITDEFTRLMLFAHELGHQWFPNMLKNYDSYAPWLSEGFAEFLAVNYIKKRFGSNYERAYLRNLGLAYIYYLPPEYDFPLTSPDIYNVENPWLYMLVTYYKGAFVVSMLNYVMGDEKFFKAMRKLYADYAGKDKYYDTKILKSYFDAAYGEPLDWFFNEWVYGKGFPIFTVGVKFSENEDKSYSTAVKVKQVSSTKTAYFKMPVEFNIITEEGEEAFTGWVEDAEKDFAFPTKSKPVRVQFDPKRYILNRVVPLLEGDIDLSGEVDGIDLIYAAWASHSSFPNSFNFSPGVDFDGDGHVSGDEFKKITDNFGKRVE